MKDLVNENITKNVSGKRMVRVFIGDYAPDGKMNQVGFTRVFLPLIFWCLKMVGNGVSGCCIWRGSIHL